MPAQSRSPLYSPVNSVDRIKPQDPTFQQRLQSRTSVHHPPPTLLQSSPFAQEPPIPVGRPSLSNPPRRHPTVGPAPPRQPVNSSPGLRSEVPPSGAAFGGAHRSKPVTVTTLSAIHSSTTSAGHAIESTQYLVTSEGSRFFGSSFANAALRRRNVRGSERVGIGGYRGETGLGGLGGL